jgi:2,3-bisphosphoglycerate-independent phosphoglycerate mutase
MSFGVDAVEAPGATGFYTSDFSSKAATMARCLTHGGYSFGFLHVKAVDDTGHDRMVAMKVGGGGGGGCGRL